MILRLVRTHENRYIGVHLQGLRWTCHIFMTWIETDNGCFCDANCFVARFHLVLINYLTKKKKKNLVFVHQSTLLATSTSCKT